MSENENREGYVGVGWTVQAKQGSYWTMGEFRETFNKDQIKGHTQ